MRELNKVMYYCNNEIPLSGRQCDYTEMKKMHKFHLKIFSKSTIEKDHYENYHFQIQKNGNLSILNKDKQKSISQRPFTRQENNEELKRVFSWLVWKMRNSFWWSCSQYTHVCLTMTIGKTCKVIYYLMKESINKMCHLCYYTSIWLDSHLFYRTYQWRIG